MRQLLTQLEPEGWVLLHKRRWPGTRRADIDHLLVGPGGVVLLDSKNWRGEVHLRSGRLWQGDDDASEHLQGLTDQLTAVEEALVRFGLAPLEVVGALVMVGHAIPVTSVGRGHVLGEEQLLPWLRARGRRLDVAAVQALAEAVAEAVPAVDPSDAPVIPVARPRPRPRCNEDQQELFAVEELDLDELERASRLSLEQWMVYLHPAQLSVVRRRCEGPSRFRGPAGCGKTVVALHRAAYLASQEPGELLFMTFVNTLPRVLSTLFRRLAPQAAERVRFSGVHQMAVSILRDAGVDPRLDGTAAETCFAKAWIACGREHLDREGLPFQYWQEEVSKVIKGRGLQDFEEYRGLARTGRRTPLSAEQRRRVWDLYVTYQELLAAQGVRDFEDVVACALDVVERGAATQYRFVLLDEAQDLGMLSVRLAAALVSDARDGLTLVGDGQQALYPGGYTLKEAGVVISGRSTVLEQNYRNTRQVIAAAQEIVRVDRFDDLEDLDEAGDRHITPSRDGGAVLEACAPDADSLDIALVRQLRTDAALGRVYAGAAVLCRTNDLATEMRSLLRKHGIPVQDLMNYDGTFLDAVKVGTVKRAKGLEFDRVFVPRTEAFLVADGAAEPERVQRERRELFVAMTRSREGLWLGRVVVEAASKAATSG